MLADKNALPDIAVKSIETARKFYESTLGLQTVANEGDEALTFKSGSTEFIVYRSEFAGTNKATAMTWNVGNDLDATVSELKAKGIDFEHYDMPNLSLQGDIHVADGLKIAWFKDPDGNILSLIGN